MTQTKQAGLPLGGLLRHSGALLRAGTNRAVRNSGDSLGAMTGYAAKALHVAPKLENTKLLSPGFGRYFQQGFRDVLRPPPVPRDLSAAAPAPRAPGWHSGNPAWESGAGAELNGPAAIRGQSPDIRRAGQLNPNILKQAKFMKQSQLLGLAFAVQDQMKQAAWGEAIARGLGKGLGGVARVGVGAVNAGVLGLNKAVQGAGKVMTHPMHLPNNGLGNGVFRVGMGSLGGGLASKAAPAMNKGFGALGGQAFRHFPEGGLQAKALFSNGDIVPRLEQPASNLSAAATPRAPGWHSGNPAWESGAGAELNGPAAIRGQSPDIQRAIQLNPNILKQANTMTKSQLLGLSFAVQDQMKQAAWGEALERGMGSLRSLANKGFSAVGEQANMLPADSLLQKILVGAKPPVGPAVATAGDVRNSFGALGKQVSKRVGIGAGAAGAGVLAAEAPFKYENNQQVEQQQQHPLKTWLNQHLRGQRPAVAESYLNPLA